jgi:non-heme chloroperoxidase
MRAIKSVLHIMSFTALLHTTLCAQDISGIWQGTVKAGKDLRVILEFENDKKGGWTGKVYSIDQGPDATPITSVVLQGSDLKLSIDLTGSTYEGKLSADGTAITGTWKQFRSLPLDFRRATKETAWKRDSSPHTVQFVNVDNSVKLEVLDWGGSGRALVLLAGLGNTAHAFDTFALKLIPSYHVYGITRRGFGESSVPASGYSADRLGDDVLAVIDALKLDRPVLVGHSIAGEELSSVGTRHPEKVAGLIYLDAAYAYAFYDSSRGDLNIDSLDLEKKLQQLGQGLAPQEQKQLVQEVLHTGLPQIQKDLQEHLEALETAPADQPAFRIPAPILAIRAGEQKYTNFHLPILAIYAVPHSGGLVSKDPAARAAAEAIDLAKTGAQAKAFETAIPSARVIRLPHANHYVFNSNEADVLREMNSFLGSLK